MIKAGIIGATGYAGQQLCWFLYHHPLVHIEFVSSHSYSDKPTEDIYGNYYDFFQKTYINSEEAMEKLNTIDVLFIALPHGKAFKFASAALEEGVKVIDLGADFRIKDVHSYEKWYGVKHECPELIDNAVYGLCELKRSSIIKASLIANPGCYTTASILALAPLLNYRLIEEDSIIVDAKSGVSGAGRGAKTNIIFSECNESLKAYGITTHRHTPEIEQELSTISKTNITINFTPHLIPMTRGILATSYGKLKSNIKEKDITDAYEKLYKDEYFIRLLKNPPETRWVKGSNLCDIYYKIDPRTNRIIVISAIDNLIKGAAGQAVQNMNILFNLEENLGLDFLPMAP